MFRDELQKALGSIREILWDLSGEMTWTDLSNASGLCYTTLKRFFSGETKNPSFRTVHNIARACGVEVVVSKKYIHMRMAA